MVPDKIGKQEAETDFREQVVPLLKVSLSDAHRDLDLTAALQRRADLFDPALLETAYSLERFHINGSRILSRSFHVEKWKGEDTNDMEVDDEEPDGSDSEGEEDGENTEDVGMTPMADLLNARYGCNNVGSNPG